MTPMPLTAGDLRVIAEALDEIEAAPLAANTTIGRIEIYRPDGDHAEPEVIGHAVRFDGTDPDMGWGFTPDIGGKTP